MFSASKNQVIFTIDNYKLHLKRVKDNRLGLEDPRATVFDPLDVLAVEIETMLKRVDILQDSELTLEKFSKKMHKPANTVSKCINSSFDQNFRDLINSRRITYSKKILKDSPNLTIEAIAFDVGFNSRATFYRAFKKCTGITPTQYLESLH